MRIVCLSILASFGLLAQAQFPQNLADVRTIFVDSLGPGEWSTVIREKIINRLAASGRFQVVLDPNKADAMLVGAANSDRYDNGSDGARWDATAVVRLITKDQRILWVSETKNNRLARSASSSVADHIVKDLLKATSPPKKRN